MLKMVCSSLPKEAEVLIVLLIGVAVSLMLLLEIVDGTSSFGAGE